MEIIIQKKRYVTVVDSIKAILAIHVVSVKLTIYN